MFNRKSKILVCLLVALFIMACSPSQTTKATKVYTATVPTINAIHDAIAQACTTNVLTPAQCTKAEADYDKGAQAFYDAGNVQKEINTLSEQLKAATDATSQQDLQTKLNTLSAKATPLFQTANDMVTALINMLADVGINVKV